MAFKDIFEEQRKKLNNYFGLGQPGLGTFGKQVSNVIKPTVSRNIQNYQKAGRYLSSQPTVAQRYIPVVGPIRSAMSIKRDIQNPQSYPRQFAVSAGKEVLAAAGFANRVNPTQIGARYLSKRLTGRDMGAPTTNLIRRGQGFLDRHPKAETTEAKIGATVGNIAPYLALPPVGMPARAGITTRAGIRGAEAFALGTARGLGTNKSIKESVKEGAAWAPFGMLGGAAEPYAGAVVKAVGGKLRNIAPRIANKVTGSNAPLVDSSIRKGLREAFAGDFGASSAIAKFRARVPETKSLGTTPTGQNIKTYEKGYQTVKVSNETADFLFKNGRPPKPGEVANNYQIKGTAELVFDPKGRLASWDTDNPDFYRILKQQTPKFGMSIEDVGLPQKPGGKVPKIDKNAQSATKPLVSSGEKGIVTPSPSTEGARKIGISDKKQPKIGLSTTKTPKTIPEGEAIFSRSTPKTTAKPQTLGTKQLNSQNLVRSFDQNVPQGSPEVNVSRFNVTRKAQKNLEETVNQIKPELEQVKGAKLSNDEVVEAAKASNVLRNTLSREKTKQATAAITKLRQSVASGAEGKGITKDFIENLKTLKSYSADAGRTLQAFNIKAGPDGGVKEYIVQELIKLGKKSDDIVKASKGVDFDKPKEAEAFYRKFVKPSMGEILDEYRYINLLSSPQTHIVNTFSNLIQGTVVNPATKLYSGTIDSISSTLTGKERRYYMREVPAYTKGFVNSIGDAIKQASEVMKGNKYVERPDINRIPTGKFGPLSNITKALEAGDIFFRTLIKGGELEALSYKAARQGKKVAQSVLNKQADDTAAYFVFRQALDPANKTGQGAVLSSIDKATTAVYKLRNIPGFKWFVPFVQTPMNILKQGIEYSPAGITTLAGSTKKTEQLAKTLLGSTVFAGAGLVAQIGDSTWAAPTGKKEKEEFYASGRKPYSLKIGDKWVSYSKLGPLAYPISMAAAVKYYSQQDPKATTTDTTDKVVKTLSGIAGFFADQSYLTGIGNLLDIARGEEYAIKQSISDIGRQYVPLSSLQGWVSRLIDPVFREGKTVGEKIKVGIPLISKSVEPYTDPLGQPSVRQNNLFNSLSPIQVNPTNQMFEDIYQRRQLNKRSDAEKSALKKGMKQLPNGKIAVVMDDEVKTFDTEEESNLAIAKDEFKKSDQNITLIGDEIYRKNRNGELLPPMTRDEYNTKVRKAKMDIAYNNKDYKGWIKLAEEELADIEKRFNEADELTQIELLNDYQDLMAKMQKYASYGGFDKPKKAKKINISVSDLGSSKIPVKRAGKFAFKTSSTPKINVISTKPKQITKSYLASIR